MKRDWWQGAERGVVTVKVGRGEWNKHNADAVQLVFWLVRHAGCSSTGS